jgi:cytochrome oxidase Cu insertion factor (SCO1/SenC/PrrC family)
MKLMTVYYLKGRNLTRARHVFAAAFAVLITTVPVSAQLGPKDGANLPPTELDRVKLGQPAPDFTLQNVDGTNVSLSDFRGKKSVVLVFYRGHW